MVGKSRLLAMVFLLAGAPAAAAEIHCPETIGVDEAPQEQPADGWQALVVDPKLLHHAYGVYFSSGPPTEKASLTPDQTIQDKKKKVETYFFAQPGRQPIWIACLYHDTSTVVARPLAEPHERCEVTYNPLTGFASVEKVVCR